ncbi:hypothetical protein TRFO_34629 [Tritrichomonas foetus]|uniref:Uncharacterized protein n=1 Tax=Tritrichomonas foetus TaxID=1144522 RepID=A0A1J4JKQ4_9EUKA|nr:hypothetical protein TRFO_34629 [Tritrichomonas foetus]|eukprot:OHS98983.1 hypothetical protein TRFO_34629 [Tritrichomonas foetus]
MNYKKDELRPLNVNNQKISYHLNQYFEDKEEENNEIFHQLIIQFNNQNIEAFLNLSFFLDSEPECNTTIPEFFNLDIFSRFLSDFFNFSIDFQQALFTVFYHFTNNSDNCIKFISTNIHKTLFHILRKTEFKDQNFENNFVFTCLHFVDFLLQDDESNFKKEFPFSFFLLPNISNASKFNFAVFYSKYCRDEKEITEITQFAKQNLSNDIFIMRKISWIILYIAKNSINNCHLCFDIFEFLSQHLDFNDEKLIKNYFQFCLITLQCNFKNITNFVTNIVRNFALIEMALNSENDMISIPLLKLAYTITSKYHILYFSSEKSMRDALNSAQERSHQFIDSFFKYISLTVFLIQENETIELFLNFIPIFIDIILTGVDYRPIQTIVQHLVNLSKNDCDMYKSLLHAISINQGTEVFRTIIDNLHIDDLETICFCDFLDQEIDTLTTG